MTLAENEDVIQAFAPNTGEKSLTNRNGFWRLDGHVERSDVSARGSPLKLQPVFVIVVANQEAWPKPKAGRFTHLLSDPGRAWTTGDGHMHDPA